MIPLRVFPVLLLILQLGSGSARNLLEEQRCAPVLEQLWKMPNATLFADLMLGIITEDPDNCALIACTRIYKPVCSTLGNTYANDCVARSCGAKIASQGPCPEGAGGDTQVKPTAKFAEDPNNCAVKPCPRILAPVCSTGGNTYDNKCIAESCNATVAYAGACKPETSSVPARVTIASTEGCQQVMCTTMWEPVCTVDGRTFGNDCQAKACGATVAYAGQCETEGTDPVKSLDGELECEDRPCPLNLAPVCSTDGRTFDNECIMESCKQTKACEGPCPCGGDGAGAVGEVPVADICPTIYSPVCDTNGVTQSNDCVAAAAGAEVACQGECPCEGGSLEAPVATACPLIELPVCGTNNITYANDCLAQAAGATVACEGTCPCEGAEASEVSPTPCPLNYMPVCGIDNNTYPNGCVAEASGTLVACQGECPCPDLLRQLEQEGGLLIVPTDDVLLDQLARSNLTLEEFAQDEQAVKLLLASLLVSPPYELDLTTSGSTSTNQAGQEVMFSDEDGTQAIVNKDALLELGVASITTECNITFVEVNTQSPYEAEEVQGDAVPLL